MIKYYKHLKPLSRTLRNNPTKAEVILWNKIRKKQILGVQFYRQKPLNGYIVDFYAPSIKLVIELDGAQHHEKNIIEYDKIRSEILLSHKITVKRYKNIQVINKLNFIINDLREYITYCK